MVLGEIFTFLGVQLPVTSVCCNIFVNVASECYYGLTLYFKTRCLGKMLDPKDFVGNGESKNCRIRNCLCL